MLPPPPQTNAATTLDTVVVSVSRTEETLREVTSNVTVIDEQTIQRSPGATLDTILRREGIHILEYPGQGTASVEMRGIRNSIPVEAGGFGARNLLLIDGRPAGTGNVAAVTKTNIERIEIIRGPAALVYGSQAMGGVVNVITKRGSGDFSGHLQTGFGSWSYQDQEGGVDGRVGDLDYSLGLFHSRRSDDYKASDGSQALGTTQKGIYSGSSNLGYNFLDDRHRIGLSTRFFYNELQGTGNEPSPFQNPEQNIKLENESFDLGYTGKNEDESLSWQLKYYHTYDKFFSYEDHEQDPAIFYNKIKTDGLQSQLNADFGLVELTGGLDWQKHDTKEYSQYNTPQITTPEMSNIGAYLLGKLRFLDDSLILTGGLRYDYFESTVSGKSATIDNWAPTVGAAWYPVEWLKLRANASKGFRTPTPTELATNYSGYGPPFVGNPDLDPEYSTNYEAGFDIDYDPSWTVGLTYFHTEYENQIASGYPVTIGGTPYQTYGNNKRGSTAAGFEMNASFDIGSYLDWSFRLEPYVKSTYYTQRKGYHDPIDLNALIRVPKATVTYGLDLDYPDWGLFINLNAAYFGSSMDVLYDYDIWANVPYETPSYTLVDVTLEKVLAEFADKQKISVKFAARNILDKDYVIYPGYPTPGSNVYMGLKYDFN